MIDIYEIKEFVKIFYVCLFAYFTYIKITNNNFLKSLMIVAISTVLSVVSVILGGYIDSLSNFLIIYVLFGVAVWLIAKGNKDNFVIAYIISVAISYVIYLSSIIVSGVILKLLLPDLEYTSKIFVFGIFVTAVIMFILLFRIKRFKNGFNFLNKINKTTTLYVLIIGLSSVIIFAELQRDAGRIVKIVAPVVMVIIVTVLYSSIKKRITKHYKKNMHDRTIEMQKLEIDEKLDEIDKLKSENLKLAETIHKYNHRLSALENGVKHAMEKFNTEFSSELSVLLDETQSVSKDFEKEIRHSSKLPLTNIIGIDNVFQYMKDECDKHGIHFSLKITDSINYLAQNVIDKEKLEVLIADHLKDGIIAVNSGNSASKSILVVMGVVRDAYEISIYDTGIDFEIDTLLKLGKERVTTHKDTGGSGIGFMTTFETLKSCKASLIIEEYDKSTTYYTKSVSFRFDGKDAYRIYSYRSNEIKKKCKGRKISINKI